MTRCAAFRTTPRCNYGALPLLGPELPLSLGKGGAKAGARRSRRGLEESGRLPRSVAIVQGGVAGPAESKGPFPAGGTSPPQQGDEKTGAWAADWCFVWLGLCVAWVPRKRGDTEFCAQVAYWEDEIKLEGLQWSEHQANPGDGMALRGLRELRQVGGAFALLHRPRR